MTGRQAFGDGSNAFALVSANRQRITASNAAIHPVLQKIVVRCLSADPEQRPQTMEEVKLALASLQDEIDYRKQRKKWAIGAAAIGLIALAATVSIRRPIALEGSFPQARLTHDGVYKEAVIAVNDSSIFYDKVEGWKRSAVRLSIDGNNQSVIAFPDRTPEDNFEIQDSAPNGNDILFRKWQADRYFAGPFSIFHLRDGTTTEVPGILGYSGAWSPDGERFAYFAYDAGSPIFRMRSSTALFVADRNGSVTRSLCGCRSAETIHSVDRPVSGQPLAVYAGPAAFSRSPPRARNPSRFLIPIEFHRDPDGGQGTAHFLCSATSGLKIFGLFGRPRRNILFG